MRYIIRREIYKEQIYNMHDINESRQRTNSHISPDSISTVETDMPSMLNILKGLLPQTPSQLLTSIEGVKEKMALCIGRACAGEQTYSRLKPSIKVVFSKLVYLKKLLSNCITDVQMTKTEIPSFFTLKDAWSQVSIYETKDVETMTSKYIKQQLKQQPHANILFRAIKYLSNLYTESIREYILPQDTPCMVFGKFVHAGKEVSCYAPQIIALNQTAMIRHISYQVKTTRFKTFLFAMGFVLCCTLLFVWLKVHIKKFALTNVNILKRLFVKSRICILCQDNISSVINVKCKHMTLCQMCSSRHQQCTECKYRSEKMHCFV